MHTFPCEEVLAPRKACCGQASSLKPQQVNVLHLCLCGTGAFSNAWRALEELGVADDVRKGHISQER